MGARPEDQALAAAAVVEGLQADAPQASGARDDLVLPLAREWLGNAARHAGATLVDMAVRCEPGAIVLSVADAAEPAVTEVGRSCLQEDLDGA